MPSPTRAMIVSSVAPPTRLLMFVRTVTRAFTFSWMPSCATPSMLLRPMAALGTSITFGFTLVCTASRMSRPARSIAVAVRQGSSMLALLAAIIALTTRCTSPPARTCDSISGSADVETGPAALDTGVDDRQRVHLPQPHADQIDQAHLRAADGGTDVEPHELEQDGEDHQQDDQHHDRPDEEERVAVPRTSWRVSLRLERDRSEARAWFSVANE